MLLTKKRGQTNNSSLEVKYDRAGKPALSAGEGQSGTFIDHHSLDDAKV